AADPAPQRGDEDGADDRPDEPARTQRETVAGDEAGQQAADERPGDAGDDRHPPVDPLAVAAADELGDGADEDAEAEDAEEQQRRTARGVGRTGVVSTRGRYRRFTPGPSPPAQDLTSTPAAAS